MSGIVQRIEEATQQAANLNRSLETHIKAVDNVESSLIQLESMLNNMDDMEGDTAKNSDPTRGPAPKKPRGGPNQDVIAITRNEDLINEVIRAKKSLTEMREKYDKMVDQADATLDRAAKFARKMNGTGIVHKRFRGGVAMTTDDDEQDIAKFIQRSLK